MKTLCKSALLIALTLALSILCAAQETKETGAAPAQGSAQLKLSEHHNIPPGSRIYVAPMEGKLDGFISAELVKKKLPIVVVIDEKDADFIITGASIKGDDKWFHSVFGTGKDKNEANIQVVSVKERAVIWAGEAGDRSLFWGNMRRGGQRRVADRLVDKLKSDLSWK
jgi:hypothetical protein